MTLPALTQKQMMFVECYIQNGGNGTAAARAAGYRGTAATLGAVAHENLQKPHIRDEITRRQQEMREQAEISTQAKREHLWSIAIDAGNPREIKRWVEVQEDVNGVTLKTVYIVCAPFDPRAAIEAIRELNRMDGDYFA